MGLEQCLLGLAPIAQGVGHHAAAVQRTIGPQRLRHIVAGAVQVAMQPQIGMGQQVVQRVAESSRAGGQAVAWVATAQAGRKVSDHYRTSGVGRWKGGAQPIRAAKALGAHLLGTATVALACQRATDEELAQIRQKAERMERIAKAGGDWPLADQEFHMAIIKASHNEYMRRLYPIINGAVNEILQVSVNRAHMQSIAIADNYMILDFLMQRDEAGARHAMSIHIRHLLNTLKG